MRAGSFITDKTLSIKQLQAQLFRYKLLNKSIAFTNGCFDILHAGHMHSLIQASTFADVLIVGLNTDASNRNLKGEGRPINNEHDRALLLASLIMVDAIVLFDDATPLELIKIILPDVLVKGGDYTVDTIAGAKEVMAHGGRVEIIPLIPGLSTTGLAEKIGRL